MKTTVERVISAGRAALPSQTGTRIALEWAAIVSGGARWARADELGPGKVRMVVWGAETSKIEARLRREASMWAIAGVHYAIETPSLWSTLRLWFAWHFKLGRRSMRGTFSDQ